MILVRSDSSGSVFIVREGEEQDAVEGVRRTYPGWRIDFLKRSAGLLLLRVAPEGSSAPAPELAIGRAEFPRAARVS